MNPNDFDTNHGPNDHHNHGPEHEHEVEEALEEALELDTQSQIFLEMRRQNLDLLRIATEVAGFGGRPHPPLKDDELKAALGDIWEIFSEFYSWIDPEEAEDDDEDLDD